jgi:hypothetical protein
VRTEEKAELTNPLDDALRRIREESALSAQQRQQSQEWEQAERAKFCALVQDFVARMNRADNPGAHGGRHYAVRSRKFRKPVHTPIGPYMEPYWEVGYENYTDERTGHTSPFTICITIDGRVSKDAYGDAKWEFVQCDQTLFRPSSSQFYFLARSMAALLPEV